MVVVKNNISSLPKLNREITKGHEIPNTIRDEIVKETSDIPMLSKETLDISAHIHSFKTTELTK